MNEIFNYCDNRDIKIYYGCVDSMLLEKSDYEKLKHQAFISERMEKLLHIETESNEAIIKNKGVIYLNNDFHRWGGKCINSVENVRSLYL
jgi:hypothetical protein